VILALIIGFAAGFIGSMPVAGPVSILLFSRGLQDRARSGAYLAIGAALAESVYAYLAFWGFSELLTVHWWIEPISRGLAAVLLTALGLRFMLKGEDPEEPEAKPPPGVGNKRSFLLGLTITALNPTLIASWSAAVTILHSLDLIDFGAGRALPFSIGVCLGISGWFVVLLSLLSRYRERFSRKTMARLLKVMGALLTTLGLWFAWRFAVYMNTLR
jgi:threonine/homoserine/homoserine lactone efflux protein